MNPRRWAKLIVTVAGLAGLAAAYAGERVSITQAVQALAQGGYAVVFSSDTVAPDLSLDLDQFTPDALAVALRPHGLTLTRTDTFWVVTRLPPTATPDPPPAGGGPGRIETVIVTGTRHQLPTGMRSGSNRTLTAAELGAVPALGGDSLRAVNRLPGTSSVGLSASPLIRGGAQDETLVRIDGVELIEPFHLADFQSMFSAIDDRTIDSVDVYTGGFPARYGNRMSGVMDVSTQRLPRTRATELGISLLSALANTRGYSDDESLWWLGSVRRGDLKFLTDRINSRTGNPKYWDAFGTIGHRLSTSSDLVVGTLLSRDDVEFSDKNEVATSNIDNRYLWLRLDTRYSPSVRSTTVASLTDSQGRKNLISPTPAEDSSGYLDFDRHTQKFALQTDWSVQRNAMLIEFGAELEYGEADYRSQAFIDRGQVGVLLGRPRTETIDIDRHVDGPSLGLYAAVDLQLNDRISIQPGVRFDTHDYYPQGDTHHVSPRLGLEWLLSDHLTARFALGRFYQPEAIHEMQVTDGVARFFSPQRADHYIAALEWNPAPRLSMHTEAYYKDYGNPKTRFENVFNPFVILPELEPDRVAIAPSSARVRGFDFEARYEFQSAVTATVRFSHLDAEDRINATWVPRRWSQHNTAHVITAWSNDRTELAAALTWHSGWFTAKPPAFSPGPLALEDVLNQAELDQYVSLDLRLARKWRVWRSEVTLYADLANVLDRDNQAGIDFDVVAVPGGFTFEPDAETLLPFIPTVGLLIRF